MTPAEASSLGLPLQVPSGVCRKHHCCLLSKWSWTASQALSRRAGSGLRGPRLLQACSTREQNGCHSKHLHRTTGLGAHIQWTDTQIIQKVIVYGLHFVRHGFWFCGIQTQMFIHLTALNLSVSVCVYIYKCICVCMCVCVYIYISFLAITSMLRLSIIV